jgi:CheY-like chemotaxis protein
MTGDQEYDCVLLDCQLPVMDGFQALSIVRGWEDKHRGGTGRHAKQHPSGIPIVGITAYQQHSDPMQTAGMDGFLVKPLGRSQFMRALVLGMEKRAPPGGRGAGVGAAGREGGADAGGKTEQGPEQEQEQEQKEEEEEAEEENGVAPLSGLLSGPQTEQQPKLPQQAQQAEQAEQAEQREELTEQQEQARARAHAEADALAVAEQKQEQQETEERAEAQAREQAQTAIRNQAAQAQALAAQAAALSAQAAALLSQAQEAQTGMQGRGAPKPVPEEPPVDLDAGFANFGYAPAHLLVLLRVFAPS